jgi:hypothetical protein
MTIDIKDFYLNTPMTHYEYMRVPLKTFPTAIINHYKLTDLTHNNNVYVEIMKGMYGLPQAGRLANDELIKHLATHGTTNALTPPVCSPMIPAPSLFALSSTTLALYMSDATMPSISSTPSNKPMSSLLTGRAAPT